MALRIVEFFGHAPGDMSPAASRCREQLLCPFVSGQCVKTLSDGTISGACTVRQANSGPVICCPVRLYDDNYRVLRDVAEAAFGPGVRLLRATGMSRAPQDGRNVIVFGRGWGVELQLPKVQGRGGYFVDWVLTLIGADGTIQSFVAVEVQSIDTTGNYREERAAYIQGRPFEGYSRAGLNWENVSKRILPQLIYKGHVLRRERLCQHGMFFVCPTPVYERIRGRLGGNLLAYPSLQPGSLTFRWYTVGSPAQPGARLPLVFEGQFITTVDQVALALTAPRDLPPPNVYEKAIRRALTG